MSDRDLVESAMNGDRDAYERLARQVGPRLYRIAYRITRNAADAEDAMQRALIDMWRDLPGLRDPERFDAWTYRLVANAATDEIRRGRRRPRLATVHVLRIDQFGDDHDATPMLPDDSGAVADRDALERAFQELTPEQRTVIVLRHYAGLPLDEISRALDVPYGTVASRLHYAVRVLRAALEAADRLDASEVQRA